MSCSEHWWLEGDAGAEESAGPLAAKGTQGLPLLAVSSLRREVPGDDSSGTSREARNRLEPGDGGAAEVATIGVSAVGKPASAGVWEPDVGSEERLLLGLAESLSGARGLQGILEEGLQCRQDNGSPEGRAPPPPGTTAPEPRRCLRGPPGAVWEEHGRGGWG